MTELFIDKIHFNSAETTSPISINLTHDQIVVFVGPNNAGKSQSLKDLYALLGGESSNIVVDSITLNFDNTKSLEADLAKYSERINDRYHYFNKNNESIHTFQLNDFTNKHKLSNSIRNFISANINTEDRLTIATPPEKTNPGECKKHPIHYLTDSKETIKKISDSFHDTFGEPIQLNHYFGRSLPLVIGEPVVISDDMNGKRADEIGLDLQEEYGKRPRLEKQGDGMRSLVGILLYLHVPHYSTFFIDEPESFLHPPQAYVMGKILCANSTGKQLFIATHSEMLLKGLIEASPERVKIVRITRSGKDNHIHYIEKEQIETVWKDPLLKYSNIMDSLFYPKTIICESNADCMFYKMILDWIKDNEGRPTDVNFIECSGKQRMHIVCAALKSLNIEFHVTPDFDLLRKEEQAKILYESCGGDWDADCKDDWTIADNSLPEYPIELNKKDVEKRIKDTLAQIPDGNMSNHDVENIREALKGRNKWDKVKKKGIKGFDSDDAKNSAERIMENFKSKGIHIVPIGEMENFIPGCGGHGKDWLENLILKYPDLHDKIYDRVKDYIKSMNL